MLSMQILGMSFTEESSEEDERVSTCVGGSGSGLIGLFSLFLLVFLLVCPWRGSS